RKADIPSKQPGRKLIATPARALGASAQATMQAASSQCPSRPAPARARPDAWCSMQTPAPPDQAPGRATPTATVGLQAHRPAPLPSLDEPCKRFDLCPVQASSSDSIFELDAVDVYRRRAFKERLFNGDAGTLLPEFVK